MLEPWVGSAPDEPAVEAALPEPHAVRYRDGEMVTPVAGAAEAVVASGGGGDVAVVAGLDAEGEIAVEATITVREVFHALLLDTIIVDFRWRACAERPDTAWGAC